MRRPIGKAAPAGMTYDYDGPILRIVGGLVGRVRTPRDLKVSGEELDLLIRRQRDYFASRGEGVEWKWHSHDLPADLPDHLVAAGFVPGNSSRVLIGLAEEMSATPVMPAGVALRQVSGLGDIQRIARFLTRVWRTDHSWLVPDLVGQVKSDPNNVQILAAEVGSQIVCTSWASFYPDGNFVNLLGGTTLPSWRINGLYRAMVAARASEAHARGYEILNVNASPHSAPILTRLGFSEITTSTSFRWMPPN